MNSLVKVPPYSKLNFQAKVFFTQNWCNITLNDRGKYRLCDLPSDVMMKQDTTHALQQSQIKLNDKNTSAAISYIYIPLILKWKLDDLIIYTCIWKLKIFTHSSRASIKNLGIVIVCAHGLRSVICCTLSNTELLLLLLLLFMGSEIWEINYS
jgi:hypothetical protein